MKRRKLPDIHLEGSRYKVLDLARGRLALIGAVFIMVYSVLALRVFDLSVFQYESKPVVLKHLAQVETEQADKNQHPHVRADIRDRNGVLLARSLKMASLYADPALVDDPDKLARSLKNALDLPGTKNELAHRLSRSARFVWVKRFLTPIEMSSVLEIGHPGLDFKTEYRRVYPQGAITSHILGYTDTDMKGIAGLEKGLEEKLKSPVDDVSLTLDIRIQNLLRSQIIKATQKHLAKAGAGIVMNVKTGEVLAAVSYPDFDPHLPGKVSDKELFNRFSLGLYELGSTFKIFSTAGYLDIPGTGVKDRFDVSKPMDAYGYKIRDFHGKKTILTLPEVFIYSSNIGAAKMGEALGEQSMKSLFSDLALADRLQLDLPETATPLLPYPWRPVNTLTASYGHGIAVTPLQFTAAAASILNDGQGVSPVFMKDKQLGQNTEMSSDALKYSVISPQTSRTMRQLLRLVVTRGTGKMADVHGYQVGGKTGTAEKSSLGGYARSKLIASFVGAFPMSDPEYAVFIMIDEPEGIKETFGYSTGGWVAAPAVGKVISGMGRILGIPKKPYRDGELPGSMDHLVRTNEEFENGVELMPGNGDQTPPPEREPANVKYLQEPKLVSY